jgi:hypothetical protein
MNPRQRILSLLDSLQEHPSCEHARSTPKLLLEVLSMRLLNGSQILQAAGFYFDVTAP